MTYIERSRFWRLRDAYVALRRRVGLPSGDAAPPLPDAIFAEVLAAPDRYTRWLLRNAPRPADLARLRELADVLPAGATIALLVDDAADGPAAVAARACMAVYARTHVVVAGWPEGLAATGAEIVAFVAPGELLAPDATLEAALAFAPDRVTTAYGDRDRGTEDGRRFDPAFVPGWSPEAFLAQMYTGRLLFFRRTAIARAGGLRGGFRDPRYDIALRVSEDGGDVVHRPNLRYTVLDGAASAAARDDEDDARAVADALARRNEPARIEAAVYAGIRHLRYRITAPGRVDILLPTRDLPHDLDRALTSIFARSTYADFRVTVIDNGSVEAATAAVLARFATREPERFAVVRVDEPFNFSRLINAGARATTGPYLLLLNNDTEVRTADWLEAMLEQAQRPPIGAVGARLVYADGTVQHAGVVLGIGGLAGHVYRGCVATGPGPNGALAATRNYSAVTAATLMVRRAAFVAAGGFDEAFAIEFNDVDFCLRLRAAGLRNVYLPHVELLHDESKSRGVPDTGAKRAVQTRERTLFRERWAPVVDTDPYFNPHLGRDDESGLPAE